MLRVTMLALLSKYLYQVSFKENPQLPCTPFTKIIVTAAPAPGATTAEAQVGRLWSARIREAKYG